MRKQSYHATCNVVPAVRGVVTDHSQSIASMSGRSSSNAIVFLTDCGRSPRLVIAEAAARNGRHLSCHIITENMESRLSSGTMQSGRRSPGGHTANNVMQQMDSLSVLHLQLDRKMLIFMRWRVWTTTRDNRGAIAGLHKQYDKSKGDNVQQK